MRLLSTSGIAPAPPEIVATDAEYRSLGAEANARLRYVPTAARYLRLCKSHPGDVSGYPLVFFIRFCCQMPRFFARWTCGGYELYS